MNITVLRTDPDGLKQLTYRFWLNDRLKLVLDVFVVEERKTKRHNFVAKSAWNRLSWMSESRRSGNTTGKPIVPSDVVDEAINMVIQSITVESSTA